MPRFNDIDLWISDAGKKEIRSYGVVINENSNLVTAYIESEPDETFHVAIRPTDMPWPGFGEALNRGGKKRPPVPFHLLATVQLDGRKICSSRAFVLLDSRRPGYKDTVRIKSLGLEDADGTVREVEWSFENIGIGIRLDMLRMDADNEPDDDHLVEAFTNALGGESLEEGEKLQKAGQIEVTLQRVSVGADVRDVSLQDLKQADDTGDISMVGATDTSNTSMVGGMTRLDHASVLRVSNRSGPNAFRDISYELIDPSEEEHPWATFRFYYRSADQLTKLQLDDYPFPGWRNDTLEPKPLKRNPHDALTKAALEPLSLKRKRKGGLAAFEECSDDAVVLRDEANPDAFVGPPRRKNKPKGVLPEFTEEYDQRDREPDALDALVGNKIAGRLTNVEDQMEVERPKKRMRFLGTQVEWVPK